MQIIFNICFFSAFVVFCSFLVSINFVLFLRYLLYQVVSRPFPVFVYFGCIFFYHTRRHEAGQAGRYLPPVDTSNHSTLLCCYFSLSSSCYSLCDCDWALPVFLCRYSWLLMRVGLRVSVWTSARPRTNALGAMRCWLFTKLQKTSVQVG